MITIAANITVEIFALVITLLFLLCSLLDKSEKTRMRFLIRGILIQNVILLALCIPTWILEGNAEYYKLDTVLTGLVNGIPFLMMVLYIEYVSCSIGMVADEPKHIAKITEGCCVFSFLLNLVSIFNGMYFTCPGGVYTRGPLIWVNQCSPTLILMPIVIILLKYSRKLGTRETIALLTFPALPLLVSLTQFFFFGITTTCLSTTVSVVLIYVATYLRRGWLLVMQDNKLNESRVSMMLSQIQPHFIYNTLTAIARLCDVDPKKAKNMTLDFSDYLRGNLDSISQKQPILFSAELKHTKIYADIEKIRFGDKLKVEYDIQTENFLIPSLTVQPLLENAIKHGVGRKKEGGTVCLSTCEENDGWHIKVSDDGVGFDTNATEHDGHSHIGISNVRYRLSLQSGGTLEINSRSSIGTCAEIFIPRERGTLHDNYMCR